MYDFKDQAVVITGAAGGLGQVAARRFHAAGAKLVLVDNRHDRLARVYADIADRVDCLVPNIDITNPDDVERMTADALAHYSRIDILLNIAGGYRSGTPLHETSIETWDFLLNLNARSVFLVSRAILPQMLEQGRGKIVNVSARGALTGSAKMGAYSASKGAVIRLTETMAAELRHKGINVNCILPGTIDTARNRADIPDANYDNWVKPDSLVDVIQFLVSDMARDIHGAAVPVYGRS